MKTPNQHISDTFFFRSRLDKATDCSLIQAELHDQGIEVTLLEAYHIWDRYSSQRDAGWLRFAPGNATEALDEFVEGEIVNRTEL